MTPVHYAIGDVHGRDDLLAQMHARLRAHHQLTWPERPGVLVHLGDMIDRGPDSGPVIDRIRAGVDGFRTVALMGNHEALMLDCLAGGDRETWRAWLALGGDAALRSFGLETERPGDGRAGAGRLEPRALRQALERALGTERLGWLRALPLRWEVEGSGLSRPLFFVHAGVAPGVALARQKARDLLWIRKRFLDSKADHGALVVHGHTPTRRPVVRRNRIGLDTRAWESGRLTAAILEGERPPEILQVVGSPAERG